MEPRTVPELIEQVSAAHADEVGFRFKRDGRWIDVTWQANLDTVRRVARALIALGVERGDKVAILSRTRLEWAQIDLATSYIGAVTVGIYQSNLAPDCAYLLRHSEATVVFVEDAGQLAKLSEVRTEIPGVRQVVQIEGDPGADPWVLSWTDMMARGDAVDDAERARRTAGVQPDDLAALVYTSGTTGVAKGAMITHDNLVFTSGSIAEALPVKYGEETLLFLPLAHVFARVIFYVSLRCAILTSFTGDMTQVATDLREIRPHFIGSVPRIYEKVHEKIVARVEAAGGVKKRLFEWALGVGLRVSRLRQAGRPVPLGLRLRYRLATRLVFRKIKAAFGGRMEYAVSGAAPLNKAIAEFFDACGVMILEGIGMTENTSFSNVNRADCNRFGTVGPVGRGIEMKLAEDGEVLFRGRNVMAGYYKNPEDTAATIDADGWLHTGDIGEIEDGFLKITDRKKDLIITAGGKNIAPQRIERLLRASPYISQALAYGDRHKYIVALITLEHDNIDPWWAGNGRPPGTASEVDVDDPRVRELIQTAVDKTNAQLASFESVKKFRIVPQDFTVESGELTPTLKIKRRVVVERCRDLLDGMYAE